MKKKFIFFVVLVLMLTFGSFSVNAAGGPTVEKVTRISEGGILVEFSEDVLLEEKHPFFGIRMLDDNGEMLFVNGGPAQFYNLDVSIIDGRTLLLTAEEGVFRQMLSQTGTYAFYRDYHVMLCIEELFPEGVNARGDGTVYNIKSRATGQRLVAHYGGPNAYDGCYMAIETNYNYYGTGGSEYDNMGEVEEEVKNDVQVNADDNTFIQGDPADGTVSVIHESSNEKVMWIALGVAAVDFIGVLAIVIVLLAKKKKS